MSCYSTYISGGMSKLNLYIWRHYCLDMSYVSVIYQVRCGAGVFEEIPREHAEQVSGASLGLDEWRLKLQRSIESNS